MLFPVRKDERPGHPAPVLYGISGDVRVLGLLKCV
jgi:hypothetical protein